MANISIQQQTERFSKLLSFLFNLDDNKHLVLHIFDALPYTVEVQLRKIIKHHAETPSPSQQLFLEWRSRHVIRKHTNSTLLISRRLNLNRIFVHLDYSHNTGDISEPYEINSPILATPQPVSEIAERFTCEYQPDTFIAFCLLKDRQLIKAPVVITGVTLPALPEHSRFTNIIVIEDSPTSVVIL